MENSQQYVCVLKNLCTGQAPIYNKLLASRMLDLPIVSNIRVLIIYVNATTVTSLSIQGNAMTMMTGNKSMYNQTPL